MANRILSNSNFIGLDLVKGGALFLALLNASHSGEEDPSWFLARYLQEDSAKPPGESEKLKLRQETLPLATFALFLREVQGEDMTAEVCVCGLCAPPFPPSIPQLNSSRVLVHCCRRSEISN